ncbi:MAG: hypothetical protein AB7W16_02205 [Candidatus Obscuribacterales bacterium]
MRYDTSDRESTNVEDRRGGSTGFAYLMDKLSEYISPRPELTPIPRPQNADFGQDMEEQDPLQKWKKEGDELFKRAEESKLKDDPFAPGAQSMDIGQSWLDREIARQNEDTMRRLKGVLAPDFPDTNEKKEWGGEGSNKVEVPSRIEIPTLPGYDNTAE